MDDNNNNSTPDKTGDNGDKSEPNEKTFTQDQVNDIVSKRLSEANQKADKRVKDEVAKALAEAERQSKLTESEREKEFKAKEKAELDERERNITLRERRADAKDVLADKGIDSSLVDFVIDVDEEKTNLNIEKLIEIVYGMPGPELFEASERGEVILGGCCIGDEDPGYRCKKCKFDYSDDLKKTFKIEEYEDE